MKIRNFFGVCFCNFWLPCKWRAGNQERQKFLKFLNKSLGKTTSLQLMTGLWVKRQKQLSLCFCKISTLCSYFLYFTTLWRPLFWQDLLSFPSCLQCTQVLIDQTEFCFECVEISNTSILFFLQNEPKRYIDFLCTFWTLNCRQGDRSSCPLMRWFFPLHNKILCVPSFHLQKRWWNVDMIAIPPKGSYHQLPWWYRQVQHLLP